MNKEGAIRFGLGAMRGVGEGAVIAIVEGRSESPYTSLRLCVSRQPEGLQQRVFEALALAAGSTALGCTAPSSLPRTTTGHSSSWPCHARPRIRPIGAGLPVGGDDGAMDIPEPPIPECETWASMDLLNKERDIVGVYISDTPWTNSVSNSTVYVRKVASRLDNLEQEKGKLLTFGGLISSCEHRISKSGRPWASLRLRITRAPTSSAAGEDYVKFKEFMVEGWMVMVTTQVKEQGFGREGLEAKLQSIELLSEAHEKRIGRLRIQIQLSALNDGWVDRFTTSVANHPGPVGDLEIYDDEAKLDMPSRTSKVQLDDQFVSDLEELCIPGKAQYDWT